MTRILLMIALAGCADQPTCPDPDDPVDAKLQCHVVASLEDDGLMPQAVTDARLLAGDAGRMVLDARPGWRAIAPSMYDLGYPGLYTTGQRAIFAEDASIVLVTFAATDHAAFVSTIELDAAGTVLGNGTVRLPF